MKGFGIYVQNDLLEPKHHKKMGKSIWLYLWCLDKMTSISEEGIGLVLGGKPIKLEELKSDLALSARTYTRYLQTLEESGYIETTRTPYGYIIKVTKAKKQFGKRSAKNDERSAKSVKEIGQSGRNKEDITKTIQDMAEKISAGNKSKKNGMNNWQKEGDDLDQGSVVDYHTGEQTEVKPKRSVKTTPEMKAVFALFDGPAKKTWHLKEVQRKAAQVLHDEYGIETLVKRMNTIKRLQKTHSEDPYLPIVKSPNQLLDKMDSIEKFVKQNV